MSTGHRIQIKGWRMKGDKLVPCYKHLPVNLQLQKKASKKVRLARGLR